jgi:chromate reductase, NAD(P)H dehydrogenase (quinone)
MKIATVSGSLRSQSSNAALLDAYRILAGDGADFDRVANLELLPHYNPDLDSETPPEEVTRMRDRVLLADLVVFSTPEYIHALPSVLKNCLEWLVSDPRFYQKPTVILHANPNSTFALSSLKEVLTTMSATIIEDASVVISIPSNKITAADILESPEWRVALEKSFVIASEIVLQARSRPD